jgi:hypothetical protein
MFDCSLAVDGKVPNTASVIPARCMVAVLKTISWQERPHTMIGLSLLMPSSSALVSGPKNAG